MTNDATTEKRVLCPSCNRRSKRVGAVTLRALLKHRFTDRIVDSDDAIGDTGGDGHSDRKPTSGNTGWRFCDSTDCEVVYFDEAGDTTFTKSQLRVAVGVKESTDQRPLCYCFAHSMASIKSEIRTKGHCDALDDIRSKMKHLGCHCELKNPSGSCCLGSVAEGINIAQSELGMNDDDNTSASSSVGLLSFKRETIANVGTLLSAVMASACCWLPLVLLAVGVSGAGIASTLEAYRPYFMIVTFGFLGAALYFAYRPKKTIAKGGHNCCTTDEGEDDCTERSAWPLNMMRLNKAMLWLVNALAIAFLFFSSCVGALLSDGDGATVSDGMNRITAEVQGITSEQCAALVAKSLRTVSGVLAVEVDHETGQALIGTEACCQVSDEAILAAIGSVGFDGKIVPAKTHGHGK